MFTTILSAIAAIPQLIAAINALLEAMKKAEENAWYIKNNQAFEDLKKAKTSEELLNAAKAIQSSISSL